VCALALAFERLHRLTAFLDFATARAVALARAPVDAASRAATLVALPTALSCSPPPVLRHSLLRVNLITRRASSRAGTPSA